MARLLYGATSGDYTMTGGGRVIPNAPVEIWDAIEDGNQITDLTDYDGNPCTVVTSGADGLVRFYGPDGENDNLWMDTRQGSRLLVRPTVLTASIGDGSILDEDIAADADIDRSKIAGTALTSDSMGVFNVRDYGADPTGVVDSTDAIQDALDAASAAKGTVVIPPGTYLTSLMLTVGSDTTIVGTGTINAVHNLHGVNGGDKYTPAIRVQYADNVLIESITIVGNQATQTDSTEWKAGLTVTSSSNVTIRNVTTTDNKGDGITIGAYDEPDPTPDGPESTNVVIDNCICDGNYRNGLTTGHVNGVRILGGSFSNTSGTAPEAGIDIEPNSADEMSRNVEIIDVICDDNDGAGIQVLLRSAATDQEGVTIRGGRISGSAGPGLILQDPRQVTVEGMVVEDSALDGIEIKTAVTSVKILNNVVRSNGKRGISCVTDTTLDGLEIIGNEVKDNTETGIRVDAPGHVLTANNRAIHNAWGITTGRVTSEIHLYNVFSANVSGTAFWSAPATHRTVISERDVSTNRLYTNSHADIGGSLNHLGYTVGFYGTTAIAKQTVTGSKGSNAALASLITALAAYGLIVDSSS